MIDLVYTGIGSRETPPEVLEKIRTIAAYLSEKGYTVRSGGADGADTAFEDGSRESAFGMREIYIPWNNFSERSSHDEDVYVRGNDIHSRNIAATLHPVFYRLGRGAAALHTRNVNQVLGKDASHPEPSSFVIFYATKTSSGVIRGGTATAVNLAISRGIPVWNLWENDDLEALYAWIDSLENQK